MDLTVPKKTIHNACKVCGKPRGKSTDTEYAHGKCMEQLAQNEVITEKKKI